MVNPIHPDKTKEAVWVGILYDGGHVDFFVGLTEDDCKNWLHQYLHESWDNVGTLFTGDFDADLASFFAHRKFTFNFKKIRPATCDKPGGVSSLLAWVNDNS